MNPFVVNNTMILWGPSFRRSTVIEAPSSNVDALREAFVDGPDPKKVSYQTSLVRVSTGSSYEAVLQYSTIGPTATSIRVGESDKVV
jgi:hypothetical protein